MCIRDRFGDGLTQLGKMLGDATDGFVIEGKANNNLTLRTKANTAGEGIKFQDSAGDNMMFIDGTTGDISFYEDTGTTAKFFWDASAECLGIGTSSPAVPLHIDMGTDNNALYIQSSDQFANIGLIDGSGSGKIIMDSGELSFTTGGDATTSFTGSTERMRIDSSGNVGIGTANPSYGQLTLYKLSLIHI